MKTSQAPSLLALLLSVLLSTSTEAQAQTGACVNPPTDLVSWWRGDGNAMDVTGNHNGMITTQFNGSVSFSPGKVGTAFDFTGSDFVELAPLALTNFTIECWLNQRTRVPITPNSSWGCFIISDEVCGVTDDWHLGLLNGGQLLFHIGDRNGGVDYQFPSASIIPLNTYVHVAVTRSTGTGKIELYINGVLDSTFTAPHNRVVGMANPDCDIYPNTIGIGNIRRHAAMGISNNFDGLIDEPAIYNRALTAAEIAAIYHADTAGKCPPTNPPPSPFGVPIITSFTPAGATPGSVVIIKGTNFSPAASNNIVYFGATRAAVSGASITNLIVTVPPGATHEPISVTANGLTALAPAAFLPSFPGDGSSISPTSFAPGQNLTVGDGPLKTIIADLDGDGKPDLVEANAYAHNISLFRNIGTAGTLNGSSFAPRVDFPALGGTDSPRCIAVADVDGDGKKDILVGDQATSSVLVYQNLATPGNLTTESFAAPVSFAVGNYPHGLRVADLNGDGLPEILVANYSGNSISILRNLGPAGTVTTNSFAAQYVMAVEANPTDLAVADLNGDGRPDLVTTAFGGTQLSVFRNVATTNAAVSNWFTLDTTLPALPGSLEFAVADMDGDSKSDLVVASVHGYAVSVYRNLASGGIFSSNSFAARVDFGTPGWAHNVSVGDFNGDAKPDLAISGELNSYMAVFQNQSTPGSFTTGSLAARVDYATGWNAWGVAAGDLDGDSRADIVFANTYDDTLTFYRNLVPFGGPTNPPISCVNPPSGLVSWWKAESNAVDPISGHNGTLQNGVTFTPGEVGQGFGFNGTDSYVNIPSSEALQPTGAFAFEAWIKYSGNPGAVSSYCIAAKGIDAEAAMDWALTVSANSRLRPHANVNGSWHYFDCDTPLSAGTWCHVAMIYDGEHLQGYVNGALDGSANVTGSVQTSDAPLRLGAYAPVNGTGSKAFFTGSIDEASFYNRNLSAGELFAIFNAGSAGKCPPTNSPFNPADGLIAHYPFSGNAADVSGNGNHGAPSNAVLAADRFGSPNAAFSFNGQNAAVLVADNPALRSLTSNYTFNAWVRFGSNPQIDAAILMKSAGAGDQRKWTFWRHVQAPPYGIGLLLNRAPGGQFQWNHDYPFTIGQWHMVTFSASSGNCLIAVDGQVVSTQSGNLALPETTGLAMSIGGAEPAGNQWFNGLLDDIRIYTRTFSSNDIAQLYQLESAQPPPSVSVVPVITSFNPTVATVGSSVTVSGTNFSPVAASNIVYFGAVRAFVTAASSNLLTATVPVGATHAPITVTVGGLTAATRTDFTPTFLSGMPISMASFSPRVNLGAGDGPTGTAIADFDGDGKPDIAVTDDYGHTLSLYWNISVAGTLDTGSFAPRVELPASPAEYSPYMLGTGDVDGDGKLDLITTDVGGNTVSVYRNQSAPGSLSSNSFAPFVSFATGAGPRSVALVDLDADGRPEIVTANYDSSTVSILRNTGVTGQISSNSFAPRFDLPAGAGAHGLAVADLDGNGRPDLATANAVGASLSLFRNIGSGPIASDSFAPAVNIPGPDHAHFVRAADLDADGRAELLVTSYLGQTLTVYRNQADSGVLNSNSFTAGVTLALAGRGHTISLGDLNGDTRPDIAVDTEIGDSIALFQNQSAPGGFTNDSLAARVDLAAGWNAWGSSVGDLDGDGRPDIIFANTYDDIISIYHNLSPLGPNVPPGDCVAAPAELVGWWRGENNTSDATGGNAGIQHNNVGFSAGLTGQALTFSGVIDCVEIPYVPGLITSNYTFEAWVKPAGPVSDAIQQDLIFGQSYGRCQMVARPGTNGLRIAWQFGTSPFNFPEVQSPTEIPIGEFSHLAGTWDGTALRLYINGNLVAENSPGAAPVDSGCAFFLGGVYHTNMDSCSYVGQFFNGTIDEASLYRRALSSDEVAGIYAAGSAGKCITIPPPVVCVPPAIGLMGWWRGNGNTLDNFGTNTGVLLGGAAYGTGKVGPSFALDGVDDSVRIPVSGPFTLPDVGIGQGLTVEAWINPSRLTIGPIFEWNNGTGGEGAHLWHSVDSVTAGDGPGNLYGNLVDTSGVSHRITSPAGLLRTNQFNHVALTYDKASGAAVIYYNGVPVITENVGTFTPQTSFDLHFGRRPTGFFSENLFQGLIDEPSIYNRALEAGEIAALYAAGSAGKCSTETNLPCVPSLPDMVGWWRGDGSATDSIAGNNGVLQGGSYSGGKISQAFELNGNGAGVRIAATAVLDVGPQAGMTIEAWIYPTNISSGGAIVEWSRDLGGSPYGAHLWVGHPSRDPGFFFANLADTTGNWRGIEKEGALLANTYQHVAVTYDRTTGLARLFVNGAMVQESNLGIFTPRTSDHLFIGRRPAGEGSEYSFAGQIDEVSIYRRALTPEEILAIYAADAAGKCAPTALPPQITQQPQSVTTNANANVRLAVVATGVPSPSYQWFFNGNPLPAQINPALVLSNVQTNQAGNYFVIATNTSGTVTSSVVTLTVLTFPPVIVIPPQSVTTTVGSQASFAVTATGTAPLNYKWYFQGQLLAKPNLPTLSVSHVQFSNAGNYHVVVSNPYGIATSAVATLTVELPPDCAPAPAGIVGWWPGQSNLWDVIGGNDATIYQSQIAPAFLYTTGKVGSAFSFLTTQTKWIAAPPKPELNVGLGAGFTFEAWVYRTPTGNGPIFAWGGSFPGQTNAPTGVRLQMLSIGGLSATLVQTNGAITTLQSLPQVAPVLGSNTWSHVALSCDNLTRIATLYVNGVPVAQTTLPGQANPIALRTIGVLGLGYAPQTQLFGVILDEPTLYNRALSQTEIQSVYTSQQTGKCPPAISQCINPAADLAGWWRGESNTLDSVAMNHGVMSPIISPVTAYTTGQYGAAFSLRVGNYVVITNAPDLNVGAGPGLTVEAWINPASTSLPILEWNSGTGTQGVYLAYSYSRGPNYIEANLVDDTGKSHVLLSPSLPAVYNQWRHLAVSYDKTSGIALLFVNGAQVTQTNLGSFTPRTTGNLYLGYRPTGNYPGSGLRFNGSIDEVAVYRRALNAAEVRCLLRDGVNGKFPSATECLLPANSLVGWWRGESNAFDTVQSNDGLMYPWPQGRYTNGQVGVAFATATSQYVIVRSPTGLNVGAGPGLTVEGWINPAAATPGAVFGWGDSSSTSLAGVSLEYNVLQSNGSLRANLMTTNGLSRFVTTPGGIVKTGQWQHVALTYDRASGWAELFVNGTPVTATNLGSFTPRTTGSLYLGWRAGGSYFTGALDEMAVHNRALTPLEIGTLARAVNGRCVNQAPVIVQHPASQRVNPGSNVTFVVKAEGSAPLRYQWSFNFAPIAGVMPLSGQTNSLLTLTNVGKQHSGIYSVRVTNQFGSAVSTNIQLVINSQPFASSKQVATPEDSATNIILSATDRDGDALTYTIVQPPQHCSLTGSGTNYLYTPHPNYHGPDSFTFKASDGLWDSAPASVGITVRPVNDAPEAWSQILTLNEDTATPVTLGASDADGDVLTFNLNPPAHGTLSGTAPNLVYTPHTNYSGADLFTFTVQDGSNAVSQLAVVSITVLPINDAPVAKIVVAPLDELPGVTNIVSLAPACCPATLRLDASQSTDAEHDALTYLWLAGTNVLSTDVTATNRFQPGTHEITLVVSDGSESGTETVTVEIITPAEAVAFLKTLVEEGFAEPRTQVPLVNWLRQAGAAFETCQVEQGVRFLEMFKERVESRLASDHPELAASLVATARAIMAAAPDCDPAERLGRSNQKHEERGQSGKAVRESGARAKPDNQNLEQTVAPGTGEVTTGQSAPKAR
jgi:hypothetical protein